MFLEINGNPGGENDCLALRLGTERQGLFRQLGKWLEESQCTVDEGARRMLAKSV
jgi:hypothetical protein